jgi:hypothetical protein
VATPSSKRWLAVFNEYLRHLRVQSKFAAGSQDGTVALKLWTSQKTVLEQICDGLDKGIHVFVILKSRQLGVTTITLAITLFWLALHPNTIGVLVADNDKNIEAFRETIKQYVASLSGFMGKSFSLDPALGGKSNNAYFRFSNGSRLDLLVAGKTKKTWGESRAYKVGHLTELAKYGQASGLASFMESIAPENPEALYILESTAFGENHWKDHWEDAVSDTFTKRAIFVGWWSHDLQVIKQSDGRFATYGTSPPTPDERDRMVIVAERYGLIVSREQLAWYRWRAAQKTHGAFDLDSNQPWLPEDAFVTSGISFFRHEMVTKRIGEIREAPKAGVEEGGYQYKGYRFILGNEFHVSQVEQILTQDRQHEITLRVWEEPKDGAQYVIGCDPAFGRNDWKDKHAISIWRVFADRMVQVAEYAEFNCETRQAAWVLAYLCAAYADCRVNIDMQGGPGQVVQQEFNHLRERMTSELYAPIIKDRPLLEDFCAMASSYIYRRPDSPGKGFVYHTVTTQTIKFKMMNIMRDCHCTDLLEIRSIPLLDEMRGIRQDGPDIGAAAQGRDKDDRVFAAALATITWVENLRSGLISQGLTWDVCRRNDSGQITPIERHLNKRIYDILRGEDEIMNAPPPRTYLEDRGLY